MDYTHDNQWKVKIRFKKSIYYTSSHSPSDMVIGHPHVDYLEYRTTDTRSEIVKKLMLPGVGVWCVDDSVWVPNHMFESIEFKPERW